MGLSQQVNIGSSSSGAGAGKVNFEPFKITKQVDTSSPFFFSTMCTGGHYGDVTLWCRRGGASSKTSGYAYLIFEFKMVAISNIAWSQGDPAPTEEVTFEYGAIQCTYTRQTASGGEGKKEGPFAWSRVRNSNEFKIE
jgi:type VI secretion system secreted protein Hcp